MFLAEIGMNRFLILISNIAFLYVAAFSSLTLAQENPILSLDDSTIAYIDSIEHTNKYSYFLSDSDIIALNAEEIADPLNQVSGFNHFDLGSLGQFSSLGYLGISKESVIPFLNRIPLETETYGTWNWHDIPFYAIERIEFEQDSSIYNSDKFQPVYFKTKTKAPDMPFSQVNYRVGDFAWRHVDITLARKIFKGISLFGTGGTERFPDQKIDNRYRGSNIWINLSRPFNQFDVSATFLSSDRNAREVIVFPNDSLSAFKRMPHSHNVKMTTLELSEKKTSMKNKLFLYYWDIKDNARGSLIYNDNFMNRDMKSGLIYDASLTKSQNYSMRFRLNAHTTRVFSTYWNNLNRKYGGNAFLEIEGIVNSNYSYVFSPSVGFKRNQDDLPLFGRFQLLYKSDSNLEADFSYSRTGCFHTAAEKYLLIEKSVLGSENKHYITNRYEINLKKHFNNSTIHVKPFLYDTNKSMSLFLNTNAFGDSILTDVSVSTGASVRNHGFAIEYTNNMSPYRSFQAHYTYQGGNQTEIFAPAHSAFIKLSFNNLEDLITSKMVDTKINITAFFMNNRSQLTFLPLLQQYAHTNLKTPSVFGLKGRGAARFQTLTFFYEIDLLSRSNYQYAWGYAIPNKRVRLGLTWDFRN